MDEWERMFRFVQALAQTTQTIDEGISRTIAFAKEVWRAADDREYWDRVKRHDFEASINAVVGWAENGLKRLGEADGWDFLLLDLGDGPDIFHLERLKCQPLFDEATFRALLLSKSVVGFSEFQECFVPGVADPEKTLYNYSDGFQELVHSNIGALDDEILNDFDDDSTERQVDCTYLLWLMVGSLALLTPLRDPEFCRDILRGHRTLYLLSGFEEIFLHLATVTPKGLIFETPPAAIEELYPKRTASEEAGHEQQLTLDFL